jgi:hypothetical protein
MRNDCGNYDADSMRELAKKLREQDINNILNTENLENIQKHINNINKLSFSINNSENLKDRKYLVLYDSIF